MQSVVQCSVAAGSSKTKADTRVTETRGGASLCKRKNMLFSMRRIGKQRYCSLNVNGPTVGLGEYMLMVRSDDSLGNISRASFPKLLYVSTATGMQVHPNSRYCGPSRQQGMLHVPFSLILPRWLLLQPHT